MPVSRPDPKPPHELELVIDFVNTLDSEAGVDQFDAPSGLAAWLVDRRLLDPPTSPVREDDRQRAIELREALRALMLAHNGLTPDPQAAHELDRTGREGQLSVQFTADGSSRLIARDKRFAGAIARLLVPVVESSADGSWQRVKACRAADCAWAFYDHSRNRSGVWCDMAVCGNRSKVRAYRRRKPSATER
jgi:predicted RNA-binding Zn ribbon-like protein